MKHIFEKMRLKKGMTGYSLYAPDSFIQLAKQQDIVTFTRNTPVDFAILFVESLSDYHERIGIALSVLSDNGTLWIAYPKSRSGQKYDINRDILWQAAREAGLDICSNVALDDHWSLLRFKINK